MAEGTFRDDDGVEVFYRAWPQDGAKAVVLIAHGASEHSGRYDRFARALNRAGYAAYALDHRAHGRTSDSTGVGRLGPGAPDALLDDITKLIELAQREVPGMPVVLFGHSMGSMIAQAYMTQRGGGVAGYVLSGCPGPMEGAEEVAQGLQAAVDGGLGDEPMDLLGGFNDAFSPARTKFDWLSRDEREVDAYIADPYCGDNHPLTYGFYQALFALTSPAMEADAIARIPKVPVLLITGQLDPVGTNAPELEKRLRDAGLPVTGHYYADARHELLNETNRDEVTDDVISWMDGVVA
jgi:alpha-beta hydrolase superfamily lysophospholipase